MTGAAKQAYVACKLYSFRCERGGGVMNKTQKQSLAWRAAILGALVSTAFAGEAAAQTVDLVDHQGAWSLYADTATPKAVCFIAAQPQAVEPLGANRGPIYFYISAWPKDGVKSEPSIKTGYPLAADKEMTVSVGTDTFKLFAKG